jgi:hypothetical protein
MGTVYGQLTWYFRLHIQLYFSYFPTSTVMDEAAISVDVA